MSFDRNLCFLIRFSKNFIIFAPKLLKFMYGTKDKSHKGYARREG